MVLPVPTHINHYVHLLPCLPTPNGLLIPSDCMNFHVLRFFLLRINLCDWSSAFTTKLVFFLFLLSSIHFSAPKSFVFYLHLSHTKRPLRSELTARSFVYSSFTLRSVIICSSISPFIHNSIGRSHSHIHISDSPFILDHPGPPNFSSVHLCFIFSFLGSLSFFAQKGNEFGTFFSLNFLSFFLLISFPSKKD